jgi:hypothetical protein
MYETRNGERMKPVGLNRGFWEERSSVSPEGALFHRMPLDMRYRGTDIRYLDDQLDAMARHISEQDINGTAGTRLCAIPAVRYA